MNRKVMVAKRTAYNHIKIDVSRKLISQEEINKAKGSLTLVPYGDYFRMFRQYVAGAADENGLRCEHPSAQEQQETLHNHPDDPEREVMDGDFWQCECPDTPNAPAMSPDAGGGFRCATPASMNVIRNCIADLPFCCRLSSD